MSSNSLSVSAWKAVCAKAKLTDNGLAKALAAWEKLVDDGAPDAREKALDEVEKLAGKLAHDKTVKASDDATDFLDGLAKDADRARAAIAQDRKDAAPDGDTTDGATIEALLEKSLAQLKSGGGKVAMQFVVCPGLLYTVAVAKKITPQIKDQLKKASGVDRLLPVGEVTFENGKITFIAENVKGGIAKKLENALKRQTGKPVPVRVRDAEGTAVLDGETDHDESEVSGFAKKVQDQLTDEKVELAKKMYGGGDQRAYEALQDDLLAARRADELRAKGGAPAADSPAPARGDAPKIGGAPKKGAGAKPTGPAGTWDPAEVKDLGRSMYEQAKPWEIDNPGTDFEVNLEDGSVNTPVALTGGRKLKFSYPVNTSFRYVNLTSVDVTFEGNVKIGAGESVGMQGQGTTDSKGGKAKGGVNFKFSAKEFEAPLTQRIKVKGKAQVEAGESGGSLKVKVSQSFEFTMGPFFVEVKVGLISWDEAKGEKKWLFVEPSAGAQGDLELTIKGVPVTLSGKTSFGVVVEPSWGNIIADIGQRIGVQGAARFATAVGEVAATAGAAETIPTGMAAIGAGEAIVASAALAGIAVTVYSYGKAIEEIQEIKEAAKAAENASNSFQAGYLSVFKLKGPGYDADGKVVLFDKGAEIAKQKFKIHVDRAQKRFADKTGEAPTDDDRKELAKMLFEEVRQHENEFRQQVQAMFDQAIKSQIIKAWRHKHAKDGMTEKDEKYLRTRLGLKDTGDLPEEVDWQAGPQSAGKR